MNWFFLKYFRKPEQKKITVIHANDHSLFRKGVNIGLSPKKDIEIIGEVEDGLQLLKMLQTKVPDIILLDYQMPVMNGMEALRRISELYPSLKVIILAMHSDYETITSFMTLGARTYLGMNSDSEEIYKAIKCVHEYGYYYSGTIERVFIGPDKIIKKRNCKFSSKELQVLSLLKSNKTEKEIARIMDLDDRTIFAIIDNLKRKTDTKTKSELLEYDINKK